MAPAWVVGLTGGIGSGKSTACLAFANRGIAWLDVDHVSRALTATGGAAIPAIRRDFGDTVISADHALDRVRMRAVVFSDRGARRRLEAIIHPMVRSACEEFVRHAHGPYAILAVPLLFETGGLLSLCTRTVVVDLPERLQEQRVQHRTGMPTAEVRKIMAAQLPRGVRLARADEVIDNASDLRCLGDQVARVDRRLRLLNPQRTPSLSPLGDGPDL